MEHRCTRGQAERGGPSVAGQGQGPRGDGSLPPGPTAADNNVPWRRRTRRRGRIVCCWGPGGRRGVRLHRPGTCRCCHDGASQMPRVRKARGLGGRFAVSALVYLYRMRCAFPSVPGLSHPKEFNRWSFSLLTTLQNLLNYPPSFLPSFLSCPYQRQKNFS